MQLLGSQQGCARGQKNLLSGCLLDPQWPLAAARMATFRGTAENGASLAGEQRGSNANRPHHCCTRTQGAQCPGCGHGTPNQHPVSFPKSQDWLVLTLSTRHSNTALPLGSKMTSCSVSSYTEDLILNAGVSNTGISVHASLLPEHPDPAGSFYCVRMCTCVYNAVWREKRKVCVEIWGFGKCSCCVTVSPKIYMCK